MAGETFTIGYLVVIITWNGCGCNGTVCMWRDHWWVMLFESIWIWNRILVGAICWIALAVVGASFLNWIGWCWLSAVHCTNSASTRRNQPRKCQPNSPYAAICYSFFFDILIVTKGRKRCEWCGYLMGWAVGSLLSLSIIFIFLFFQGGTSNGNADASHSDSGDSHLSPPSKLKKCSVCISPVVFYSPHTHLSVAFFYILCWFVFSASTEI